jgi:predicted TIM-barrel fold metal-dependent hydrolase
MMRITLVISLAFALLAAAPVRAADAPAHYTMADYARVEKIDAHMHLHSADPGFVHAAQQERFKVLTINVDYPDFPPLVVQQRVAVQLKQAAPDRVAFVAAFPADRSDQPGWADETKQRIDEAVRAGAVGVKVWKNIGMTLRARDGRLVMVDDPRFAPVFEHMAQRGIPLLGHQGEPYNCWLPLAEMTVNNDREYFREHPQYHMALHPEMPSWDEQMAARDRMLTAHPSLRFIGMHLASLERSVDELGSFLERFPNAMVDVAARVGQLQYQSQRDRERVRRFFIRYQDRLIYGSDLSQASGQPAAQIAAEARSTWRSHWRYFNTNDQMKVPELNRAVRGLALPTTVVDKLYRLNALRAFPGAWGQLKVPEPTRP